jgi:hypothetical protein
VAEDAGLGPSLRAERSNVLWVDLIYERCDCRVAALLAMTCGFRPSAFDMLAIVALFVVNADDAAAFRAFVLLCLLYDECVDSVVSDELKVLDHAHTVFCAIALIQLFQARAGLFAFKTKLRFTLFYQLTVFDPASNAIKRLICIASITTGTFFLLSEVTFANPAVHAAGGNQLCIYCSLHFPLVNCYRLNDKRSRALHPEQGDIVYMGW